MWDMKFDMGGSATVVGLMKAVALRQSSQNVLGVVGAGGKYARWQGPAAWGYRHLHVWPDHPGAEYRC